MSDITERLRERGRLLDRDAHGSRMMFEAADEIDRLRSRPETHTGGERYTLNEVADMLEKEGHRLLSEKGEHYVGRWESAKWLRAAGGSTTPVEGPDDEKAEIYRQGWAAGHSQGLTDARRTAEETPEPSDVEVMREALDSGWSVLVGNVSGRYRALYYKGSLFEMGERADATEDDMLTAIATGARRALGQREDTDATE